MWHKGLNRYSNSVGKIIFGNKNETDTGNKNIFHTFYFVTESFGKVPYIFAIKLQLLLWSFWFFLSCISQMRQLPETEIDPETKKGKNFSSSSSLLALKFQWITVVIHHEQV